MRSVAAHVALVAVALAAGSTVSSCGTASPPAAQTSSSAVTGRNAHSDVDVAFLQNMLVHHRQGVALARLVAERTDNAALTTVAAQVGGTELSEIQAFQAQLVQWEIDPGGGDPGAVLGMADQADVDKLHELRGPAFDTLWLQTMMAHERGGIAMARNEIEHGQSVDIISIAKTVAASQQAGLDLMEELAGSR